MLNLERTTNWIWKNVS